MRAVIFLCLVGCGAVKAIDHDAATDTPGIRDAAIDAHIDAPIDAVMTVDLTSIQQFPAAHQTVADFTAAELAALGATATGFSVAGGGLLGNTDAPFTSPFISMASTTQVTVLTFNTPIRGAGISCGDIDFGNDNPVNVTVAGFDAGGGPVATFTRAIMPANTAAEENANAIFVGWTTLPTVTTVKISIDQNNSTAFDNFVFVH
jgi:hypothetical protein